MMTLGRKAASIYVDRTSQKWIVRDPDGNFWVVPVVDDPWDHRQPFDLSDDVELEPIPGHYKYMLGLPF